jgi:hypothetical protein
MVRGGHRCGGGARGRADGHRVGHPGRVVPGTLRRPDVDHGGPESPLRRRADADGRPAFRAPRRPRNLLRRGPRGEPNSELRPARGRRCGHVCRVGVRGGDCWPGGKAKYRPGHVPTWPGSTPCLGCGRHPAAFWNNKP